MRFPTRRLISLLLVLLAGCSTLLLDPAPDAQDAALRVPKGLQVDRGSLTSSTGCQLDYRLYSDGPHLASEQRSGDLVVLAHGFLRNQDRMQTLATTLAQSNLAVATLDFCNPSPWDGRHVQNAQDMVALARSLGATRIVYMGFSAGALAAVVAARSDPHAIGVVALDLVEAKGIGVRAANGLDVPLLALTGEPTNCNALDNGQAVYAVADVARVQRIEGAGHCDFEAPTDRLCELVCQDPNGDAPSTRAEILASATQAVHAVIDGRPWDWASNPQP